MPRKPFSTTSPPVVTLFSANPSHMTQLDLEGERRAIMDELDAAGLEGMLHLQSKPATTPKSLQRTMMVSRPTVVQFSGHGRGSGTSGGHRRRGSSRDLVPDPDLTERTGIMLHGEHDSTVKIVSGAALGELFSAVRSSVRLVFLSACHSAQQVDAIVEHVDFVIGIDGAITDAGAKAFAVALYRALAFGFTVQEAFGLGTNALKLEGFDADEALLVLRARRGADPATTRLWPETADDDGKSWDVFVSYASDVIEPVVELVEELRDRHLRVFFDEEQILPGQEVRRRLEYGLDQSSHGLMAISPAMMALPLVQEQYSVLFEKAMIDGKLLIPVLVGPGTHAMLPPFLRLRRPVDLRGRPEDYLERVGTIARAVRGQEPGISRRLRRRGPRRR